jgi:hypothetical protein
MAFIFVWYVFPPSVFSALKSHKNGQKRHIYRPPPGAPYIRARVHTYGRAFIVIYNYNYAYLCHIFCINKNCCIFMRVCYFGVLTSKNNSINFVPESRF